MKEYDVYGIVTGGKFIGRFRAESPERAEELAWAHDNTFVSICHQCTRSINDPSINELQIEECGESEGPEGEIEGEDEE